MLRVFRRLRAWIKYRHFDRDLVQEIEAHRAMAQSAAEAAGADSRLARYEAGRALGDITMAREDSRAMWIPVQLQQFSRDVRYAWRGMWRAPGFTLAALSMLTIGLGLVTGFYSIVNGLFHRPWPVPDAEHVFVVDADPSGSSIGGAVVRDGLSPAAYAEIRRGATVAEYVAMRSSLAQVRPHSTDDVRVSSRTLFALHVSDNFIHTLGIPMQRGTGEVTGSSVDPPRMVISAAVWQSVFAGDPNIVGRTAWIGEVPVVVSGVIARGFERVGGDPAPGILVSLEFTGKVARSGEVAASEHACCIGIVGRLRPDHTLAQAESELGGLVSAYRRSMGRPDLVLSLRGTTLADQMRRGRNWRGFVVPVMSLMGAAFLLVLVLTCANVGNLFLARSFRREREIVTRLAIGASRPRIVRQLVTEGFVLASIAGVAAFLVAACVPRLLLLLGDDHTQTFAADWRVATFAVVGSGLTCLIVSLAPALQTTRIAWRGTTPTIATKTGGLRKYVLATQVATASALVLGAVLLARGIVHAMAGPTDFALHTTAIATIQDEADRNDSRRRDSIGASVQQAIRRSSLEVGMTDTLLIPGSFLGNSTFVRPEHSNIQFRVEQVSLSTTAVNVLEIKLASGRWPSDDPAAAEAVVNETLARQMWSEVSPLGQTVVIHKRVHSIVGVARDAHLTSLHEIEPVIHTAPAPGVPVLVVRAAPGLDAQLTALVQSIDPALKVSVTPLSGEVTKNLEDAFVGTAIAGALAVTALVLAIVGTFGVFAYSVEERRREIGIRLALGASRVEIRRTLLRAMRTPVLGGLVGGLMLSAISSVLLRGFLFGLSPIDPVSYFAVACILALAGVVATAVPVRRALRVDPAVTLKAE